MKLLSYLSVKEDITARKQIEAALRESEARWKFALEGAGDGVWDWNVQTSKVFFSKQWKAMLGYAEDKIGDSLDEWEKRIHPDDLEEVLAKIDKHFKGQTPNYISEYRLQCKDGTYKWFLDRGKVLEWTADHTPLRVISSLSDITDQKQTAEKLRLNEARYRRVSSITSDIAYSCAADEKNNIHIDWMSGAVEQITGYTIKELKTKH